MWLLPHFAAISTAAVRTYYRATVDGADVPASGPLLIVANHPNSLMDPACLAWVARRPLRFLAKAPLFSNPLIGWLVRGSGSIPVYRRHDDPAQMSRNDETFRAVHDALGRGSAVALFPEGISHSNSEIAPLRTGAARIALGAALKTGGAFPIVPVGLLFRAKARFRSEAHSVVGAAIEWDDLAGRTPDDHAAVRELTSRIERAIRNVTLNLAKWEDELVVRTAEGIWAATHAADPAPAARIGRLGKATQTLARLRASDDPQWAALARDVRAHARLLRLLGLRPSDVSLDTRLTSAARWAVRRLLLLGIAQGVVALAAALVYWIPYRVTGVIANRMTQLPDTLSTYRVLVGTVVFALWIIGLTAAAVMLGGWGAGLLVLVAAPVLGIAGLTCMREANWTLRTARRWLLLRRRDPRIASLWERQRELAHRLDHALATAESA